MTYKKTIVLFVSLLLVLSVSSFAETKKITRVNVYPFVKGGVPTIEALKAAVEKNAEDIKIGFEKAGVSFLYQDFMDQVKTASMEEKIIPKGQKFQWMLFKAGKKAKAVVDVEWAGKKTLDVISLWIQKDCKEYEIIVPKVCGNISLVGERNLPAVCNMTVSPEKANVGDPITIDMTGSKCATRYEIEIYHPADKLFKTEKLEAGNEQFKTSFPEPGDYIIKSQAFNVDGVSSEKVCEGKVYINFPPVCDLKVTPLKGYTGQVFKLDATGSTDPDGKVVKADFSVTDAKDGKEVEAKSVTSDPLVWERIFKKTGKFDVTLNVTDDFNARCLKPCVTSGIEVQKRSYLVLEAGPGVARGTYSAVFFGRVGWAYLIKPEKLSFVGTIGGAAALTGDPFKHHLLINAVLNAHFNDFFVGAGLGYHTKIKDPLYDAGLDLVGQIGYDVFKAFNKKGSIFGELRANLGKDPGFKHGHEILLGFRMLL